MRYIRVMFIGVIAVSFVVLALHTFLNTPIVYHDIWMDSPLTQDKSLTDKGYLLSTRIKKPMNDILNAPVVVLCHGFTGSTYGMEETRRYLNRQGILTSSVLLGGHGRDVYTFRDSRWEDWGATIKEEVIALQKKGYKDINLLGVSTGGTLIMHYIMNDELAGINRVFLVDPYILPQDKRIKWVKYMGWLFNSYPPREKKSALGYANFYSNQPYQTLIQLNEIRAKVEKQLREKVTLPKTVARDVVIYHAGGDPIADPEGSSLLQHNILPTPQLTFVKTPHHAFIHSESRVKGIWKRSDTQAQYRVFRDIVRQLR